ncbi:MAG TPA: hypothetical protein PLD14_00760 [Candidatus Pacearchaeota archaeon]|nr:hypothetical protein [Candidatus Pacearchaeota archaeon]HPR79733.1 hypothetical protein [Candidatus Pacearchaeota archaeon]
MHRKEKSYIKAISLRKKGFSYNEILDIVPVGHGTISRWCCDIELTEKQKNRIKDKQRNVPLIKNLIETSIKNKEQDRLWANKIFSKVNIDKNALLVSGAMLYWAEGYNSGTNQSAIFTNTNPEMVKIMMRFFREILLVDNSKMKVMVRIGEKGDVKRAENYWSKITGLSMDRFQKPEILKLKENSKSLERCPNGICRLSVYDVTVRRKIYNLISLMIEKMSPHSSVG